MYLHVSAIPATIRCKTLQAQTTKRVIFTLNIITNIRRYEGTAAFGTLTFTVCIHIPLCVVMRSLPRADLTHGIACCGRLESEKPIVTACSPYLAHNESAVVPIKKTKMISTTEHGEKKGHTEAK